MTNDEVARSLKPMNLGVGIVLASCLASLLIPSGAVALYIKGYEDCATGNLAPTATVKVSSPQASEVKLPSLVRFEAKVTDPDAPAGDPNQATSHPGKVPYVAWNFKGSTAGVEFEIIDDVGMTAYVYITAASGPLEVQAVATDACNLVDPSPVTMSYEPICGGTKSVPKSDYECPSNHYGKDTQEKLDEIKDLQSKNATTTWSANPPEENKTQNDTVFSYTTVDSANYLTRWEVYDYSRGPNESPPPTLEAVAYNDKQVTVHWERGDADRPDLWHCRCPRNVRYKLVVIETFDEECGIKSHFQDSYYVTSNWWDSIRNWWDSSDSDSRQRRAIPRVLFMPLLTLGYDPSSRLFETS